MRRGKRGLGDQRNTFVIGRDLERLAGRPVIVQPAGRDALNEVGNLLIATTRRHVRCQLPHAGQHRVFFGRQHHVSGPTAGVDDGGHRFFDGRRVLFDFDREAHLRETGQHFFEGRNDDVRGAERARPPAVRRESVAGVELLQGGQSILADRTETIGGPFEGVIVKDDDVTVLRRVHVEFDVLTAQFHRTLERGQRIFGPLAARPAVGEQPRLRAVEESSHRNSVWS